LSAKTKVALGMAFPWLQTSSDVGYDDLGTGTTSDKYVITKKILDEKSQKYAPITTLNANGENLD